jgi:hypothetical protein
MVPSRALISNEHLMVSESGGQQSLSPNHGASSEVSRDKIFDTKLSASPQKESLEASTGTRGLAMLIGSVPIEQSGLGFLLASAVCTGMTILSYFTYLRADYFILGSTRSKRWEVLGAGYTPGQFVGLFFGTYLLSLSIIFMLLFLSHSFKNIPHHHWLKLPLYSCLWSLFAAATCGSFYIARNVLTCMSYVCRGADAITNGQKAPKNNYSGKNFVGMLYFFVSLFFLSLFTGAIVLLLYKRCSLSTSAGDQEEAQEEPRDTPLSAANDNTGLTTFGVTMNKQESCYYAGATDEIMAASLARLRTGIREQNKVSNSKWLVLALLCPSLIPLPHCDILDSPSQLSYTVRFFMNIILLTLS